MQFTESLAFGKGSIMELYNVIPKVLANSWESYNEFYLKIDFDSNKYINVLLKDIFKSKIMKRLRDFMIILREFLVQKLIMNFLNMDFSLNLSRNI